VRGSSLFLFFVLVIVMMGVYNELYSIRQVMETMERHYGQVSKGP